MKNKRSFSILLLLALTTILLSACSAADGKGDGFFHTYFVEPFIVSIHFLAELFNGNYGLSIILVTLIIRLILLPFMLKQYKNQMDMKEKMDGLKPEMEDIQKRLKEESDPKRSKNYSRK